MIWRSLLAVVLGLVLGGGAAAWQVRSGALGNQIQLGPWTTGRDFGSAAASPYTRAVVALRGLLALPAREARYYNAATDSAGAPLNGRCRYRVSGAALPAKWWSLTLYDPAGYLVPNPAGVYAIGSVGLAPAEQTGWQVLIAPRQQAGHWLPSGGLARFELTLRTYLPADGGRGEPAPAALPRIDRLGC
ncbi:DUF1214 domain-containing protein [Sphingomonas sp.]|uniref:DUF1214 domain-containing protein n=1 Tax=Sphingomonas sp. TaxID=28214 RepID=UPI001D289A24|nr:DUF1214 domain-containing protein [Sphingomonas sp.]MBX9797584.1 DUF1214 domain-containing protein [Sphingomonas sp.]